MSITASPYVDACRRSVPPAVTVERIRPHLSGMGITRVANITGLDRIGIPVFVAVRPNARSLSLSQGKGLEPDAARASAIGESIEAHHAEYNDCLVRLETYAELSRRLPAAAPEQLPLSRGSVYTPWLALPWTEGLDVLRGEPTWVPYELVHANACLPRVPGSGCFVCSTNGLAAGNTLAEATLHGLCEVVERDACALWERLGADDRAGTRLDLESVDDPACLDLLARFEDADIDVLVWDVTSDVGLPVYRTIILDRHADELLAPSPGAFGAGCHPDPAVALSRALTEAAQSRLTVISGARDDLTRERYRGFQAPAALRSHRRAADAWRGHVPFRAPGRPRQATVDGDLALCVEAVAAVGVERLVVVDLSRPGIPMAVARTIVPGLEGPIESPSYRPGPRALARTP